MASLYRNLIVWQKAFFLAEQVYVITKNFPKEELYGLTSQMRRAVAAIPTNITEGYHRNHPKEYIQFLMISKGSLGEVETYLMFLRDLTYISAEEYEKLEGMRQEVGKLLRGLIKSLC